MKRKYVARSTGKGRPYYYYRRAGELIPLPDASSPDFDGEYERVHLAFEAKVGRRRWPRAPYLYCIGAGRGPYKLGVSQSVGQRMIDLQIGNHKKINVVRLWKFESMKIAAHMEEVVHRALTPQRMRGEWFKATADEIADKVADCAKRFGVAISAVVIDAAGAPKEHLSAKV